MSDRPAELFSVRGAARWLSLRGVRVHENTIRNWVKTARIPSQRRPGGVLIARGDLEHIVQCPICSHREEGYTQV